MTGWSWYFLDTHVIYEPHKAKSGKADIKVVAHTQGVSASSLFVPVVTILKLETGILLIERRDALQGSVLRSWLENQVLPSFMGRILSVDVPVAQCCVKLHVPNPRSDRDALIAAIGLVRRMAVVTRNIADFQATGVEILNPWN